jgi:hypothetical protein
MILWHLYFRHTQVYENKVLVFQVSRNKSFKLKSQLTPVMQQVRRADYLFRLPGTMEIPGIHAARNCVAEMRRKKQRPHT